MRIEIMTSPAVPIVALPNGCEIKKGRLAPKLFTRMCSVPVPKISF